MTLKELYKTADYKDSHGMLFHGDCLEIMKNIEDESIDMILCDLPYGTSACKWDSVIPFEPLWEQYSRIIKPFGAIVLFGSEPFSSALRLSNLDMYKYDWKWEKPNGANFLNFKYQPAKVHIVWGLGQREQLASILTDDLSELNSMKIISISLKREWKV